MRTLTTLSALSLLALSACASGPQPAPGEISKATNEDKDVARYQPYVGQPIREFNTLKGINGWDALSDDKLVVFLGVNEAYLITVGQPCSNLEFANNIGFTNTTSNITTFDFVLLRNHERCPITEIRSIDEKRRKEDLRAKNAH